MMSPTTKLWRLLSTAGVLLIFASSAIASFKLFVPGITSDPNSLAPTTRHTITSPTPTREITQAPTRSITPNELERPIFRRKGGEVEDHEEEDEDHSREEDELEDD